jgi:hypothetical protein
LFFYLFDDGMALLAHHLPAGYVGDCFLDSATAPECKLVEVKNTSRYQEQKKFFGSTIYKEPRQSMG